MDITDRLDYIRKNIRPQGSQGINAVAKLLEDIV